MSVNKLLTVSMLALLAACSSGPDATPVVLEKASTNQVVEVPKWYLNVPETDGTLYGAGEGTAPDIQMAVMKATIVAKARLADKFAGKISAVEKRYDAFQGKSKTMASEASGTYKNVLTETVLEGMRNEDTKLELLPGGMYRAFVLVSFPVEKGTTSAEPPMPKSLVRGDVAFQELDKEVKKTKEGE
jgi:hypothetical protein